MTLVYECAAYIHNPFPELLEHPSIRELIDTRIRMLATQLDISEQRIAQWSYIKGIMATCWAIDDNLDPHKWVMLCDILKDLLQQA